jgi:hypothetical protein
MTDKQQQPPEIPERIWLIVQDGSPLPTWYRLPHDDSLYEIEREYEYARIHQTDDARVEERDKALLAKLREPVDEGGYDGWYPDPLHVSAANRIEELLKWLSTEQSMHAAWRKRAEECEAQLSSSERRCPSCGHAGDLDANGICQTQIGARNWGYCRCKCVFPATGVLAQARHRVDVKANVDWLKANAQNFAGEWVAIRSGVLLDVDKSHSALLQRIGPTKGTDILVTWACDPATGVTTAHETVPLTEKAARLADGFARRLRSISNHAVAAGVEVLAKEIRELATTGTTKSEQQLAEIAVRAYVDRFDAANASTATAEGQDAPFANDPTWDSFQQSIREYSEQVNAAERGISAAASSTTTPDNTAREDLEALVQLLVEDVSEYLLDTDPKVDFTRLPNIIRMRLSRHLPSTAPAPAGVEAAAKEIADWITQTTPLTVGDALRSSIQRIVSNHCAAPMAAESDEVEHRHPTDKQEQGDKFDENLRWLDEQVTAGWPSEAQAEDILREYGTSGKEITNAFIDQLLRERQQLMDETTEARINAIAECVQVVETYGDSIGNPSANIIRALESLAKAEGEAEPLNGAEDSWTTL